MLRKRLALGAMLLSGIGLLTFVSCGYSASDLGSADPTPRATISLPPVAEAPQGLGPVALKSLATAAADALRTKGETEAIKVLQGGSILAQPCEIKAFTGGPTDPPGLTELSNPRTRAYIRRDATQHGWQVGFGHSGKVWLVVAEACPNG